MLAFKTNDTWARWSGQPRPFNGEGQYNLSRQIEATYSDAELAGFGLYRVEPATIPEGKRMVSFTLTSLNGKPVQTPTLEDIPAPQPADFPLSMRQLRLGLVANGFPVDFIATTIAAIQDAGQRAVATIWYEETSTVFWDHPMTQQLIAAAGLTQEQAGAMWLAAKDLEA